MEDIKDTGLFIFFHNISIPEFNIRDGSENAYKSTWLFYLEHAPMDHMLSDGTQNPSFKNSYDNKWLFYK